MSKHNIVMNDFGKVEWTPEHEAALLLMNEAAYILQMTVGEFADMMIGEDRECPCCADLRRSKQR